MVLDLPLTCACLSADLFQTHPTAQIIPHLHDVAIGFSGNAVLSGTKRAGCCLSTNDHRRGKDVRSVGGSQTQLCEATRALSWHHCPRPPSTIMLPIQLLTHSRNAVVLLRVPRLLLWLDRRCGPTRD